MSVKRRLAIVCGAAIAAVSLMLGSPAALAAPKTGPVFTVTCPEPLGTFEVVVPPGDAPFTPAFIVGTHQVAIPYRVTGTVTVDGQVVEEFDVAKKAPVPADAITCEFQATFTEGDVTATVTGSVTAVVRGAP